jgi:hypothetical protein
VLTAENVTERAEALFWLIHLLTVVSKQERILTVFAAKMLAFACTERGDTLFEEMARKRESGE